MAMSSQQPESLESALVRSIDASTLRDAATDLAEVGLDQMFEDGILRDIPVLGTLVRLRATLGVVQDYLFTRKVAKFLIGVARVDEAKRKAFVATISSPTERRRLGETLVLLLDRLDDLEKPDILARMFCAYIEGRCDLPTFRRLALAVYRLPVSSLHALRAFYDPNRKGFQIGGEYLSEFASVGLASINFFSSDMGMAGGSYGTTELGTLFLSILGDAP